MISLLAIAWIFWLARKRGQNAWLWVGIYFAVAMAAIVISYAYNAPVVPYAVFLGFVLVFWASYAIAPPELQRAMDAKSREYAQEDAEKDERWRRSFDDWVAVKVYTEAWQQHELQHDRDALVAANITPAVKSAGITTLMVHQDAYDKACELLGVLPASDDEEGVEPPDAGTIADAKPSTAEYGSEPPPAEPRTHR
jgi:hypothetical protein